MTAVATIVSTDFPELEQHVLTNGVTVLVETDDAYYPRPFLIHHPAFRAGEAQAQALTRTELLKAYARATDYSRPLDDSPWGIGYRFAVRDRHSRMMEQARRAMASY